ncbi:hypothetical protein ACH474_30205 [Nocardia rhamnosiphila]|uniref:hypothetical protein n=1 Tax=Nocardia rhamnosiphila TaxID=426716 RepID=UPI0004C45B61|nr:hypothetical protein [Nocardia rhamnosiphila]
MASEVERIGEECRRYADHMVERMAETKRRSEARSRELTEQAAAEMRQLWRESAERVDDTAARGDAAAREQGGQSGSNEQVIPVDEQSRGAGRQPGTESGRVREAGTARLDDEELRTRREAIARSAAARRNQRVVTPVDDDGDDEAQYYRRNSWLV